MFLSCDFRRRCRKGIAVGLCAVALSALGFVRGFSFQSQPNQVIRVGISVPLGDSRTGIVPAAEALRSESLLTVSDDGRLRPRLAQSWARSSDGGGWLFTLAPGVRFHNSKGITAGTIVSLLRTAISDPLELRVHPGFREIRELAAVDDKSFVLRSRTARLSLLDELAEVNLSEGAEDFATGPFRISDLQSDGFTGRAFEHYYGGRPAIDTIRFDTFRSVRAAWAAMMRDEIDAVYEVGRDAVEFVERDQRVQVYPFLRPYLATMFVNVNLEQFRDKQVRVALNNAVDRESIVKTAYKGRGRVAGGPMWPEHWAVSGGQPIFSYSPASAIEVLARRFKVSQGARLRFRCLVVSSVETQPFERTALMLQKQFFDVGVDMELEPVDAREFQARLSTGRFEAALFEALARTPGWVYSFWRSPSRDSQVWIRHGYSGADRELDSMHLAEDEEGLRRAIADVYRRMSDDPPAVFIAWPEVARAVNRRFEVPVEKGADIMGSNMRLWRPVRRP